MVSVTNNDSLELVLQYIKAKYQIKKNSKISMLTMKVQFFEITFINVYTPFGDKPQKEKNDFYDWVDSTLNALSQYRIKIILGDLNGKIGKEVIFRSIIGGHSVYEITNDNGLRLSILHVEMVLLWKVQCFLIKIFIREHWCH